MVYDASDLVSVITKQCNVIKIPLFRHGKQPQLILMMGEVQKVLGSDGGRGIDLNSGPILIQFVIPCKALEKSKTAEVINIMFAMDRKTIFSSMDGLEYQSSSAPPPIVWLSTSKSKYIFFIIARFRKINYCYFRFFTFSVTENLQLTEIVKFTFCKQQNPKCCKRFSGSVHFSSLCLPISVESINKDG